MRKEVGHARALTHRYSCALFITHTGVPSVSRGIVVDHVRTKALESVRVKMQPEQSACLITARSARARASRRVACTCTLFVRTQMITESRWSGSQL